MKYNELIDELALSTDLESKAGAKRVVELLKEIITNQLKAGNSVELGQNFGKFEPINQPERTGESFGKSFTTPAKTVVKFRPSSPLKRTIA